MSTFKTGRIRNGEKVRPRPQGRGRQGYACPV